MPVQGRVHAWMLSGMGISSDQVLASPSLAGAKSLEPGNGNHDRQL